MNKLVTGRIRTFWDNRPVCNIEQVLEARFLGVIISGKFAFHAHIKCLQSVCSQRLYLLKFLRQQGLPQHELNILYSAMIVNRLTYALPAWAGFLTADLTSKLNSLLKKCFQYGYSKQCNKISQLIEHADDKLFATLNKPEHCVWYLLYLQSNLLSALCDLEAMNTLFPNASIVCTEILLFVEFCTAKLARNQSRMFMLIRLILLLLWFIDLSCFVRCVLCTYISLECFIHVNCNMYYQLFMCDRLRLSTDIKSLLYFTFYFYFYHYWAVTQLACTRARALIIKRPGRYSWLDGLTIVGVAKHSDPVRPDFPPLPSGSDSKNPFRHTPKRYYDMDKILAGQR